MEELIKLWPLAQTAMQAFGPFYRDRMVAAIQESGAPNNWYALSLARGQEPRPITVDFWHATGPYTARKRMIDGLEELAGLELLEQVGPEAYRLTDPGREAIENIFASAQASMADLEPLPPDDIAELERLLGQLVDSVAAAAEPDLKRSFAFSRWTDPGPGTPSPVRIDQFLTELLHFRDDAHLAAWAGHNVEGHLWEAFTFVCREQAQTAAELVEQLPYRQRTEQDYAAALGALTELGWVESDAGRYRATTEGTALRQEAEEETDRLFFAPWSCFSELELSTLRDLLFDLKDSLTESAAAADDG